LSHLLLETAMPDRSNFAQLKLRLFEILLPALLLVCSGLSSPAQSSPEALNKAPLIQYHLDAKGRHHYQIPVAYGEEGPRELLSSSLFGFPASTNQAEAVTETSEGESAEQYYLRQQIPGARIITLHPRQGFHFTSRKPLPLSSLRKLFDEQAILIGKVPYWVEISMLGKKRITPFAVSQFKLVEHENKMLVNRADMSTSDWLKRHGLSMQEFRSIPRHHANLRLPLDPETGYELSITSRTAMCDGHDFYSVRVLNAQDQVVWENTETLGGTLHFLPINLDEDLRVEIVIVEVDHGNRSVFVFDPAAP